MPFTGKATYSAGDTLPEIAEDVADLVAIASAAETPLLDILGDAARPARSILHEWLEDAPLPNTDSVLGWVGRYRWWLVGLSTVVVAVLAGGQFRSGTGELTQLRDLGRTVGGDDDAASSDEGTPGGDRPGRDAAAGDDRSS